MAQSILSSGHMPASLAASVVGKFGFLNETMYGKVGRAASKPIRTRAQDSTGIQVLEWGHRVSLRLMAHLLDTAPPRELRISKENTPITLLYTDASDVPARGPLQFIVGAVIFPKSWQYRSIHTG
jgi:hypothetical protein